MIRHLPGGGSIGKVVALVRNQPTFWNLALRIWQVLAGLVSILAVARFLNPAQQGYYYTINSLLSMTVFFEMGLSVVLVQFASHEHSLLSSVADGVLAGDTDAKHRLAGLAQRSSRWYAIAAAIFVIVVLPIGVIFFSNRPHAEVSWVVPWVCIVVGTGGNLALTPTFAIAEGCGRVAQVARMRLTQSVFGHLGVWSAMISGLGLGAMPLFSIVGLVVSGYWFISQRGGFMRDLLQSDASNGLNWKCEVWPMQWRIAISWISGYFIYQLFTPILFWFATPQLAGRMGMSLTVSTAITTVGMAWMAAKAPGFGSLVARRDWRNLDASFRMTAIISVSVTAAFGVVVVLGLLAAQHMHLQIAQRVLDPLPFSFIIACSILNTLIFCQASYLRAHKREPLLGLSVCGGIAMLVVVMLCGYCGGPFELAVGYFLTTAVIGLGFGSLIFFRRRREWHADPAPVAEI